MLRRLPVPDLLVRFRDVEHQRIHVCNCRHRWQRVWLVVVARGVTVAVAM